MSSIALGVGKGVSSLPRGRAVGSVRLFCVDSALSPCALAVSVLRFAIFRDVLLLGVLLLLLLLSESNRDFLEF